MGGRLILLLAIAAGSAAVSVTAAPQEHQRPYNNYWPGPPASVWNWNRPSVRYQDRNSLWDSGWIPIRDLDPLDLARNPSLRQQQQRPLLRATPADAMPFRSNYEAELWARRFYPKLFQQRDQPSFPSYPVYGQPPQPSLPAGSVSGPWDLQQNIIQEVTASCDRKYCYKSCRLSLLGGGRCTKAGCMCYHAFFDYDGKPLTHRYSEDYIWYSLTTLEQRRILDAMREGVPKKAVPTKAPLFGENKGPLPSLNVGGGGGGLLAAVTDDDEDEWGGFVASRREQGRSATAESSIPIDEDDPWFGGESFEEDPPEQEEPEPDGWWGGRETSASRTSAPAPPLEDDSDNDDWWGGAGGSGMDEDGNGDDLGDQDDDDFFSFGDEEDPFS